MAFNTGNPVPSTDGRDLSDNAEALDKIVNQAVTVTTRTGKIIKSIPQIVDPVDAAGTQGLIDIAADVDAVNAAADVFDAVAIDRLNDLDAAYVFTAINNGVWAEFETFTALNQYMVFTGTAYKPKNSTSLPYIVGATPVGDNNVEVVANLSTAQGDARYDRNFDILADAIASPDLLDGFSIKSKERSTGKGGGAVWNVVLLSSVIVTGTDIVASTGGQSPALALEIEKQPKMSIESLGVVDEATFVSALLYSGTKDIELIGKASFTQTVRINLPQRFHLKSKKGDIVLTASASYFAGAEAFMVFGDAATNIIDSCFEGVTTIGGLTDANFGDGIDRHGIRIDGCINTSIRHCRAETLERGILIRDGATGGEIAFCESKNCYDQGVGYIGTSSLPITDVELHHNFSFTVGLTTENKPSGIRTEEVYDSKVYSNRANKCEEGVRIENSGDNDVYSNKCWENDAVGLQIYNQSHRNTVHDNNCFDNNVANYNDTDLTDTKSNANTRFSGIELQSGANNNILYGNKCYQTTGGIGHQKYGIIINPTNLLGSDAKPAYNQVYLNQCFNNELGGVEDRGFATDVRGNTPNDFHQTIVRNA